MAAAWAHLPNKMYIDQVLGDLKNHQDLFAKVYEHTPAQIWPNDPELARVWEQMYNQIRGQTRFQAYEQARDQAYEQAYSQARDQAYEQARHNAYYVARAAFLALFAYDDASKYLTMPADQAMTWGELVGDDQYILLKPYLLIKHEIALLAIA
jgi:hypothetical protein